MRTTVKLEEDLYKKSMSKAATNEIYSFSELVRQLLTHYTVNEESE